MNLVDHAPDALLRRPVPQTSLARTRRIHPPKRVTQEVELSCRDRTNLCLLLVHRQLQLAHDRAHPLQGFFRLTVFAQNHEVISVGDDATAQTALQPELLPRQHKPPHVQIG